MPDSGRRVERFSLCLPVDVREPLRIDCVVGKGVMRFCVFSSGSKQNCFYVESDAAALLIDMGVSFRAVRGMLAEIGREIGDVQGLFISHEHSDHTRGLATLAKRTTLPIHIHPKSYRGLNLPLAHARELHAGAPVVVGDLIVQPFPVRHDAANTFGFTITHGARTLFLASDIGGFDASTLELCGRSHAIAIESNYDLATLRQCGYPAFLKSRISGSHGHLSNDDAVRFLQHTICPDTTAAFMLHLSQNSNSHALVQQQIDEHLANQFSGVQFHISHRDRPLPMVEV